MKYFVNNDQRKGTCYHEFYKGIWDEHTFWASDSLCLHDDVLFEAVVFTEAISALLPAYNPFGETEVYPEHWKQLGVRLSKTKDKLAMELYSEADEWVQSTFKTHGCFTIIGI